jgi:hypothetical protein
VMPSGEKLRNRPLTEKELRQMFAALDRAEDDRLARRIEQEQKVAKWKPYEEP